jgi:ADP-ribosylglycohydrolase
MNYRHSGKAHDSGWLIDPPTTGLRLEATESVDYQDKFRGAMVGTAIGDALGRPAEGMSPNRIRATFGELTDFHPWHGWREGPVGTFTDDTEMALCIAESFVELGRFDPVDVAERFRVWGYIGRGMGTATRAACRRLDEGMAWNQSGSASAGNGAAMRAAPLALIAPFDIDELRRISAESAIITHADPTAVASTVAVAFTVAYLLHTPVGTLDLDELLSGLDQALAGIADPELPERRVAGTSTLLSRIHEVFAMRSESIEDIFRLTQNGAFVMESLPAAFGAFISNVENPERATIDAVMGGYDSDTIGAMAGAFAGAYHGYRALPSRWTDDIEFGSGLTGLADGLSVLASVGSSDAPQPDGSRSTYAPFVEGGALWITRAHHDAFLHRPNSPDLRLLPHPAAIERLIARIPQQQ